VRYGSCVAASKKVATCQDVLDAPEHLVAEIIRGTLSLMPRPPAINARSSSRLGGELSGPFDRRRGGPGGWVLLDEPELRLGDSIVVPDLAGWRRSRMPELSDVSFFTLAPDWACEVLSPPTEQLDRAEKLPLYAEQRVTHAWLLSPIARTLEVFELDGRTFRLLGVFKNDDRVRAPPFEVFELELGALWER
jgi:Uma2 family endonuclease